MFPTTYFRIAYDTLQKQHSSAAAVKEYLKILYMAAYQGESQVELALKSCLDKGGLISSTDLKDILKFQKNDSMQVKTQVVIDQVNLKSYDQLLEDKEPGI